jgi:hypothetical protein
MAPTPTHLWHCPLCKAGGKPSGPRRGVGSLCVDHADSLKLSKRCWCNTCKRVVPNYDYAAHSRKCYRCRLTVAQRARHAPTPPAGWVPCKQYAQQFGVAHVTVRVWLRAGMHPAACRVGCNWWVDPTVAINRPQWMRNPKRKRQAPTLPPALTKPKPRWETTPRSLARYFGVAPTTYQRALNDGRVAETATTITLTMAPRGRKKRATV